MSTVVGVMDRAGFAANTDNLVLVEPERQRLLWIPRDLWCETIGNRINSAYRLGGPDRLQAALREHGLGAPNWLVLTREAAETALADVAILVPIPVRMVFDYPLSPTARIEDGRKRVVFEPPAEVLRGERVHQWIGARGDSDLHRIERQKVLVRRLLEQGFDFGRSLANPDWVRCSGPAALEELGRVRPTWRLQTLDTGGPAVIAGMEVLLRRAGPP